MQRKNHEFFIKNNPLCPKYPSKKEYRTRQIGKMDFSEGIIPRR
jgi:hypothetical protein